MESGKTLAGFHLAYTTHGTLSEKKDNVVWVFHALTANSDPAEWWQGLVGPSSTIDPARYFIVCVNMPGSCYGSIGPLERNEATGRPFFHNFPLFTTRDMIKAYQHLQRHLGIEKIALGLGGSMGGQQLLEWAIEEPALFDAIIPIATNARHSAWGIAFNATQRLCIEHDPTWQEEYEIAGIEGMKTARAVALISYRNYLTYVEHQTGYILDSEKHPLDEREFRAASYQKYQGEKLAKRFNAFSYHVLSRSMDTHDVGRGRGTAETALQQITAKALVIGLQTDILFPVQEQAFLAQHIKGAQLAVIDSLYGHDGFLTEAEKIGALVGDFLRGEEVREISVAASER